MLSTDQPARDARRPETAAAGPRPAVPGLRRNDPCVRRAAALADAWAGLPEGVTRWRLAAALRAAAKPLGLSAGMLRLLEHYLDLSYDQDWAADSEPVICRPLVEIADAMDLSERQVRSLERGLAERGLLAFRDSGNHHRRGRRDRRSGRLVYAYGPSLAPLGVRAAEILRLAETARGAVAAGRRARLAISALRRRIRVELAAAEAAGADVADLAAAFAAAPARVAGGADAAALEARRAALDALCAALTRRLGPCPTADDVVHSVAQPEVSRRHHPDTSKPDAMNGFRIPEKSGKATGTAQDAASPSDHGLGAIPLGLALAAAGPMVRAGLDPDAPPRWRALVEAARVAAPALGVDAALWGEACGRLGRAGAAVAAIVLEGGLDRPPGGAAMVRNPAAYWQALLARAETGELRLDRSTRAVAARRLGAAAGDPG